MVTGKSYDAWYNEAATEAQRLGQEEFDAMERERAGEDDDA